MDCNIQRTVGNMRRLPPWMLSGATTVETAAKNASEPEAPITKAEKRPRRTVKPKEKALNLNSEKPKRVRRKIGQETKPSSNVLVSGAEDDEDLTVDDLISFAQQYVKGEEVQTREEERKSVSLSESMLVADESNMSSSSQGGTRDSTTDDMLGLLLGPFFKKN